MQNLFIINNKKLFNNKYNVKTKMKDAKKHTIFLKASNISKNINFKKII